MKNSSIALAAMSTVFFAVGLSLAEEQVGQPLPESGGAPFAAYLAVVEATRDAEWSELEVVEVSEHDGLSSYRSLNAQSDSPHDDYAAFAALVRSLGPARVEFIAGHSDGQQARLISRLIAEGREGVAAEVDVELFRAGGHWYVEIPKSPQVRWAVGLND